MADATDTRLYRAAHRIFLLGLILKGLNAAVELVVGSALLLVPAAQIRSLAEGFLSWAAGWVPADWVGHFPGWLHRLDGGLLIFIAWYFLSHGVLKAFVIGCLAAGRRWAYPLGIMVFVLFGVYQTFEYFHGGGVFYLVLDVLDAVLIGLTAMEWRHALHSGKVDKASAVGPS